jgi:hypothetical protein
VINAAPEVSPIAAGANLIVNFALCPTANVNGSDGALISKPLPDTAALVIVNGPSLEFMIVTIWLLLEPTGTPPKLRLAALTPRFPDDTHPDWKRATKNTAIRIRTL